jgi:hypothetical protein
LTSDLIELSTRHNFVYWLTLGAIHRGGSRSASGDKAEWRKAQKQRMQNICLFII